MPVDGAESRARSVRDLQRGTDTLVAVHPWGPDRGEVAGGMGGQQRGRVENALTARERASESLPGTRGALAVSRDNWDTVYYRLRAIYAVRGV